MATSQLSLPALQAATKKQSATTTSVLKNPKGKQRKQKKVRTGISFGPEITDVTEEPDEEPNADGDKPRCSVVQIPNRRKSSSKSSDDRRASRGSIVSARGILSQMNDPEMSADCGAPAHTNRSIIKAKPRDSCLPLIGLSRCSQSDGKSDFRMSAHEDLVNARSRVAKRALLGTTFDFVKSNLLNVDIEEEPPDHLDANEPRNASKFAGSMQLPMRQSLFFGRKSIAEKMNNDMTEQGTFRRETMAIDRAAHSKTNMPSGMGLLAGLGNDRRRAGQARKSIMRKNRSHTVCQVKEEDELEDQEPPPKLTFYGLVKSIIRARRWNVPLYIGNTKDEEQEDAMSPFDFDLAKFKSDSWRSCPSKLKFLMTLSPWERTEDDIEKIRNIVLQMRYFDRYSDAVKTELARVVRFEAYGNGRIIIQQGHPGFAMYFILSGGCSVQVLAEDEQTGEPYHQIVNELNTGQIFGELALMNDVTRTATIVCRMDSEFLRIDREDFDNVLRRAIEIEWNDRMMEMQKIPYFKSWPQSEINEINPHSNIKHFKINTVLMGDRKAGDMSEYVYFVVKGRCHIVRRITMLETSKVIGKYDSCKRITKFKRIPNGNIDKYLEWNSTTKNWRSTKLNQYFTTKRADKNPVCSTFLGKQLNQELLPNQLLKRQLARQTVISERATKTKLTKCPSKENSFRLPTFKTSLLTQNIGDCISEEVVGEIIPESQYKTRIVHKYLIVNKLERGDSFGFGENLQNIFIVSQSQVDCLTIPSHIMMRAERHVDSINRESQSQTVKQMANQMRRRKSVCANYEAYAAKKKQVKQQEAAANNKFMQTQGKFRQSTGGGAATAHETNSHYVELKQIIEDKIPSERLSYERWRLNEDWKGYKTATLQEVINNKTRK